MNNLVKKLTLTLALVIASANAHASLAEVTITGTSNLVKTTVLDPNVMAFIVQHDAKTGINYAILAEYDRFSKIPAHFITVPALSLPLGEKGAYLTSWVNRMYLYQLDRITSTSYELKTLKVDNKGDIVVNHDIKANILKLKKADTLVGAEIQRFEKNQAQAVETIVLNNKYPANSTWENMVPGRYFGTNDNTGGDYFKKSVNTNLSEDGVLIVNRSEIKGTYQITEKLPKMFTVDTADSKNLGVDKITNRIVVFVDIVNWKGLNIQRFTTEELLIINPEDANDVGFYYERH